MARNDRVRAVLQPVLDAMQTMPSFVYLIPAMMLFGLGKVPAVFATVIYAVPPIIRLTDVGIRGVPESVVEAARSFGASDRQLLFDVQLPLAFPSIMVGINQTTMMALAMVVIASMIGARGLGLEVLIAINRIEVGHGFTAGASIVFLAIVIDRISSAFARKQQKHLTG
jgi:glycine betaine/proline transport system permease protein